MKYFVIIGIVAFIVGCADSHQVLRTGNTPIKLDPSKSIYISIPQDGKYEQINYPGSGVNAAQILLMTFSKYSNSVKTGHQYQSVENALIYSKENIYSYLVFPTILEWEDRATEWSGIPDRAAIKINIINVASGRILDSAIIKGKSGLATFGGDHPQDLLPRPIDEYVRTLFF